MNLGELRQYVWEHMDLDETEISTVMLDAWCREGTRKVVQARKRWPFLQHTWGLVTVGGQDEYLLTDLIPEPAEVASVIASDRRLRWIGVDTGEGAFLADTSSTGTPAYYSVWGSTLTLYPTPAAVETLTLRGYRKVHDWVDDGAGAVPDLPEEMQDLIRMHLLSAAYAQQEDIELSEKFANDFQVDLERFKKQLGTSPPATPLVIGGNSRRSVPRRLPFPFE